MKRSAGLQALLWLACAGWGLPSQEQLLRWVVLGPDKPYHAVQRVALSTGGREVESEVEVWFGGEGRVRRSYSLGVGKLVVLQLGGESWQTTDGSRWFRLAEGGLDGREALRRASANYTVTSVRAGTLLGRRAVGFQVRSKNEGNPWRELWLEADSGWPLSESVHAPDGRVRSRVRTVLVEPWKPVAAMLAKPVRSEPMASSGPATFEPVSGREEAERRSGQSVPAPGYVPPGYSVVRYGVVRSQAGRLQPAVRYSDGLSTFTIFRRFGGAGNGFGPGGRFQRGRGAGGPGGASLRSDEQRAVVQHRAPSGSYLLLGDLAESELRRVAESLP